jgi:dipeptidyl aminopeptidase/acylaminoacyl peptidase
MHGQGIVIPPKPPLDTFALRTWPSLQTAVSITGDGRYFTYFINNQPVNKCTFVIKATSAVWEKRFILDGTPNGMFSVDDRQIVFSNGDSLCVLFLGTDSIRYVTNISSYRFSKSGKGQWLAYKQKNGNNKLVLEDICTGNRKQFDSVGDFSFSESGNALLLHSYLREEETTVNSLKWVSLPAMESHKVWSETNIHDRSATVTSSHFDISGTAISFIVRESFNASVNLNDSPSYSRSHRRFIDAVWYYKDGMERAVMKVDDGHFSFEPDLFIGSARVEFSKNGRYIFVWLQSEEVLRKKDSNAANVDVWTYRDTILQSVQLEKREQRSFLAAVNVESGEARRLEGYDDLADISNSSGDYIIVGDRNSNSLYEPWRNVKTPKVFYVMSLKDGTRKILNKGEYSSYYISPYGRYIVYFDANQGQYFSYEVISGQRVNISKSIHSLLTRNGEFIKGTLSYWPPRPVGIAGWLEDDSSLLIYDNYDIWLVDAAGHKPPLNLTNGYGRLNRIEFRLVYERKVLKKDQSLLLTAFNTVDKFNGFYTKPLSVNGNPDMLTMGPYSYYITGSQVPSQGVGMARPLKAAEADVWVVERQDATEAPNLFLTRNFKQYYPLTDFQPQKAYNWLTADLISWKQPDGTRTQGILYKPENFDAGKKYPIIFYVYEQLSQHLYEFPYVECVSSDLNIPWFVSHGYLVLAPDIHFNVGKPGESVMSSVVSAAGYMATKSWIDSRKMGIQGHSFGGYETNYLVTHTHLFAAAESGEGVSDLISSYGEIKGGIYGQGLNNEFYYEGTQGGMGATLWEKPNEYISNSPVFNIDKVTTPILLMNNIADPIISSSQGLEFFNGLRRLNKKVWMLRYDGEGHGLDEERNQLDFTIRLTQFFDHYLKGAPAPIWMTQGIPAKLKGIETGYELDTSGRQP